MTKSKPEGNTPKQGILLQVQNGDVIAFDETGLRLNLADSVIADIQKRLEQQSVAAPAHIDASVLGDINAWNVSQRDGWYLFQADLPGAQGIGAFRRSVNAQNDHAPHIIAQPSFALYGLLALGGTRRASTCDTPVRFPYHVLSTADDMGAAGPAGTLDVGKNAGLEHVPEQTRDTLVADEIVARRKDTYRALPVIYVRGETDAASSVASLSGGAAMQNFIQSVSNFCAAAQKLGVPPKVLAVSLDLTLEAVEDDADSWHRGMYDLMQRITDLFADHGLRQPLFVAQFEAGTQSISDQPVMRAQWDLAWNKGGHDFIYSAPSYMFALDDFGRPTDAARQQMAQMDACAIEARNSDLEWACPLLLLAERDDDPCVIRCTAQSMNKLVLDDLDPLNAGAQRGFALERCENDAQIVSVAIDPAAENDLLVTCDKPPIGDSLRLTYALGHASSTDGMPANRGALRDDWAYVTDAGETLHRWALPAALPVH